MMTINFKDRLETISQTICFDLFYLSQIILPVWGIIGIIQLAYGNTNGIIPIIFGCGLGIFVNTIEGFNIYGKIYNKLKMKWSEDKS